MLAVSQPHDPPQPAPPPSNIRTSSALVCPLPPTTATARRLLSGMSVASYYCSSSAPCFFSGFPLLCWRCINELIRGGGINRVKHHLAEKGGDIEVCQKVSTVVRHQFNQNIDDLQTKKRKTQEEYAEVYNACNGVEREFDEIERNEIRQQQKSRLLAPISRKEKQLKRLQYFFPSAATPVAQPTIKSVLQSKEIVEKCDIAIARWMMDANVPFNAVNSAYYQQMIDVIANIGAWYKVPNYGRVRGYLLSKLVEDVKKMIEYNREIWKQTGCTIMADGWTDNCRRTLINFLVYCPKRIVFLKSVDTSHVLKTDDALFKLLRDVVLFVGLENFVHVVTDNATNYVATGRLLKSEFSRLYWSPCAAHCVNLIFQDIGKLEKLALDDLGQLNLEDDRDDDEANNNSGKNANQNETNQDVAPNLSDETKKDIQTLKLLLEYNSRIIIFIVLN
ncbi:uncharacterized protein LOC130981370 [Arachis stenosperma]|uniref:uncharacterized protein LOC130981370 n=1 Tax=Arachis stenosperma TaxID=217475 RepID=UPI0025AD5699|nr:uncharacterized protein LOC130981370 [Arachis stenosperma]